MKIKRGNKQHKKEQKEQAPKRLPDIIVQRKHNNFTIISNEAIRDPNMSWKAKGLLTLLIGNKEGWYTYKETIKKYGSDGEISINSGLKELEQNGYLIRLRYRKKKDKSKRIIGSVWLCSDTINEFDWKAVYTQLAMYGLVPQSTKPNCGKAPTLNYNLGNSPNLKTPNGGNIGLTIPINNNTNIYIKKEKLKKEKIDPLFHLFINKLPTHLQTQKVIHSIYEFFEYRKETKNKIKSKITVTKLVNKIKDLSESYLIDCIDNSISKGWTGLFPPNKNNNKSFQPKKNNNNNSSIDDKDDPDDIEYQRLCDPSSPYYGTYDPDEELPKWKPKYNPQNPTNHPDLPGYQMSPDELIYEKEFYDPFSDDDD
jgi:hypothetical protein